MRLPAAADHPGRPGPDPEPLPTPPRDDARSRPPRRHGIIGAGDRPAGEQRRPTGPSRQRTWTEVTRPREGRVLGGVCAGVARAYGLDPIVVRILAVALVFAGGSGALLYVVAWLLLPQEGADQSLAQSAVRDRRYDPAEMLAVGAVRARRPAPPAGDGALVRRRRGVAGAAVRRRAGRHLAPGGRRRPGLAPAGRRPHPGAVDVRSRRAALARVVIGVALVVGGVGAFLAASDAFSAVRQGLFATAGIVAGLAVDHRPVVAAHGPRPGPGAAGAHPVRGAGRGGRPPARLRPPDPRPHPAQRRRPPHGRHHGPPPGAGAAHAGSTRATSRPTGATDRPPTTLAAAVTRAAEEVEVDHGVSIDVVAVGDAPLDDRLEAVVAAAREAMVNAAKWSGATSVSVYVEVGRGRGQGLRAGLGQRVRPGRGRRRPPRPAGVDHRPDGPPRRPGRGAHRRPARAPRSSCACPGTAGDRRRRRRRPRPGRGSSWSTTTTCSARACGPSWATPSRWWARRRRSTPRSR